MAFKLWSLKMNLSDRIEHYKVYTGFPVDIGIGESGRLFGIWEMGNDYRVKSGYYGGYPAGYLKRVRGLFPEFEPSETLHLFSGKVDQSIFPGMTVDINSENEPDFIDDAQSLKKVPLYKFKIVLADPPYSIEDCNHYQTTMIKRNVVMKSLGTGLKKGTFVVWLDQVLPMYRKDQFKKIGSIGMVKSTNHRFRVVTIFERI